MPPLIILGPTASGKEDAAFALARRCRARAEIIVVDSMKIYRGLNIGTAKPTAARRAEIPHHGLDLASPEQNFSVAAYVKEAAAALAAIERAGKQAIFVGGTALYYKGLFDGLCAAPAADAAVRAELTAWGERHGTAALHARLRQLDAAAAAKIHPHDARRLTRALEVVALTGRPFSERQTQWAGFHSPTMAGGASESGVTWADAQVFLLHWERPVLRERIATRVRRMLDAGLLDEARAVYDRRETLARTPLQAVGYKEFFPYFAGESSLAAAVAQLTTRTCQLAKSQMTWFRKFPAQPVAMRVGMTGDDTAAAIAARCDA
ncbi:tRNA dimethylallyltransferase [Planctomycetales bacterium]|nr:tRNA dimethylallyltransferase [Planctomycetales bacterium]GHS98977.1 tRNA dimethylallyltransferase [Planctomycetales bacterium]GHT06973.1 tRNA dimethylallyltransferase [Planctomycetales bacterium]